MGSTFISLLLPTRHILSIASSADCRNQLSNEFDSLQEHCLLICVLYRENEMRSSSKPQLSQLRPAISQDAACRLKVSPQSSCYNLIPSGMVFRSEAFGGWLGHEGRALMNGISTLPKGSLSLFALKGHWGNGCLWTRKQALTGHQICQCLALVHPSFQNGRKSASVVYKSIYGLLLQQPEWTHTDAKEEFWFVLIFL